MTECSCCCWAWALDHSWGLAAPPVMKGRSCCKLKQHSKRLKVWPQIFCVVPAWVGGFPMLPFSSAVLFL